MAGGKEKEKVFYVYVDRTEDRESNPEDRRGRVFYVGKGDEYRVKLKARNEVWHNIDNKYGSYRETLFATKNESYALQSEIELIKSYNTFIHSGDEDAWGANLTAGGEGTSGRFGPLNGMYGKPSPRRGIKLTDETKRKISIGNKGKQRTSEQLEEMSKRFSGSGNPMYGRKHTEENRQKISEGVIKAHPAFGRHHTQETKDYLRQINLGRKHTEETKEKLRIFRTGKKHTDATKAKVSAANKGKIVSEDTRKRMSDAQIGHTLSEDGRRKIGEANSKRVIDNATRLKISAGSRNRPNGQATLTSEKVLEIRAKSLLGQTRADLAKEYGITKSAIGKIINRRTWKHI